MSPAAARGTSDPTGNRRESDRSDGKSVRADRERNRRILDVIRSLREGEVVTYGEIADDAGFPKMSRLVGRLLAINTDADLPWWRVVNSTGRLVPGNEREQIALLKREGVTCENGRVRSARFGRFSQRRSGPRARIDQPDRSAEPEPTDR